MRKAARLAVLALVIASSVGCTMYRDELVRSQQLYDQAQYERSLGLLRALEPNVFRLATPEQAEYAYLRGMADYRLGYRPDARHWLAIAHTYEDASPGTLPADFKARMNEALEELNGVVYGEGIAALAMSRKPGEDLTPPAPPPAVTTPAPAATPAAK